MPANYRAAFQVEHLKGKFTRPISRIVQDVKDVGHIGDNKKIVVNRIEHSVEEFNEAYMLWFPQGHSMMVSGDDHDTIRRLGLHAPPPIVDMDTGEEVPETFLDNKAIVMRKESNRPRPLTGGLTDIEQEL